MNRPERSISLLFDLFVVSQRVRRMLATALAEAELRADEYAVYSLLLEQGPITATEMSGRLGMPLTSLLDYLRQMDQRGHLRRDRHPRDGRARRLSLTLEGLAAQRRTNVRWEAVRTRLEGRLAVPPDQIRAALYALDDAVTAQAHELEEEEEALG